MLSAFQRLFRVLFVIGTVSECGVLIFIYGWPFLQTLAMHLIGTVSFQLRIRRNRDKQEFKQRSEQSMDMGTSALSKKPWWTLPENFHAPMVFHMEEDQEELIFGHGDTYLRCIEVHSHTLIQLESWFTATGQTRVTVVGPHRARQWLLHMFCCVGSQDSYHHARGGSRAWTWEQVLSARSRGGPYPKTFMLQLCSTWKRTRRSSSSVSGLCRRPLLHLFVFIFLRQILARDLGSLQRLPFGLK
uniref:KH-like RNA-binding domain-containing protein n=1 Tax=Macaca fascicularis TaxID=9541 RepID=A0A2K5UWP9_MACFA